MKPLYLLLLTAVLAVGCEIPEHKQNMAKLNKIVKKGDSTQKVLDQMLFEIKQQNNNQ